ncbi:MAG TPA: triacylglycerol lipase [Pseudoxanthomonas sp.]
MVLLALCLCALPASAQSDYTKTKYPVVLVHGLFGFDKLFGSYDYWFMIPQELRAGGAKVYAVNVSSANSSALRGEQVIDELETLQALYGHQKFNLIGHSHGGPTARYVASVRPDLVASVTSVGSPHTGSKVADVIADAAPDQSLLRSIVSGLANALANVIEFVSGDADPQDSVAALESLNSAGAAAFNAQHPQGMPATACGSGAAVVNNIRYYSAGGTSVLTNVFDPIDPGLVASSLAFGFSANDGLVGRCSSHLGVVLRDDYPWNHLDEVNQTLALRGLFTPNPVSFYRSQANRLKAAGL